ncbi:integrase [Caballeronia jiangsuensis]|nr:integrase [Caballeronia jiangsuensis]
MAWLELVHHEFYEYSFDDNKELVITPSSRPSIENLPQIFWEDGAPWDEVNAWSLDRAVSGHVLIETVQRLMRHLCRYANYLEKQSLDWRYFPVAKDKRVLVTFRGYLVEQRDADIIEGSTASSCMNATIMFYRFGDLHNLVGAVGPMWEERNVFIAINDRSGFKRTLARVSTDLKIKNNKRVPIARLEEGLLPIRSSDMSTLNAHTATKCTIEFHLMLSIGFFTGARIGTIVTLTVSSLNTAREASDWPGVFYLPVGPGTTIATKHSVKGNILVPFKLFKDLKTFATSTERLKREALALPEHQDILFLTRSGKPFTVDTVGALVRGFRASCLKEGMQFMSRFKFHDSRATFGTNLLSILLVHLPPSEALGVLRDAMLHKDEETTFDYIKFNERTEAKEKVASEYSALFTGRRHVNWDQLDA